MPEGAARFACSAIAILLPRNFAVPGRGLRLLKVKAPMAGHGKSFDRTSMSGAAIAASCGWFHLGWFHLRACRSSETAGRAT
jgi:hypothetical protein